MPLTDVARPARRTALLTLPLLIGFSGCAAVPLVQMAAAGGTPMGQMGQMVQGAPCPSGPASSLTSGSAAGCSGGVETAVIQGLSQSLQQLTQGAPHGTFQGTPQGAPAGMPTTR